jgi:hypothetical protein
MFMTACTVVFVAFAAMTVYAMFSLEATEETSGKAVAAGIAVAAALIGCVFAVLASTLWREIIGPRRDSHA